MKTIFISLLPLQMIKNKYNLSLVHGYSYMVNFVM